MIRFIKEYFGGYYLLFFFSYLSIYFFPPVVPIVSVVILIVSYCFIIRRQRFDVIIALILYSRGLNGFVFLHNETAFFVINLLTNVFPTLLYFFIVLSQKGVVISKSAFVKYKYTILFFILLTISFIYNFLTSYDLLTKRYLPFAFFVFFLVGFTRIRDFNVNGIIRFFRSIFAASIIVFFFSDYLSITRELVQSDSIFSVASAPNSFSLTYFTFTRNLGPAWDHRIMAIMAYLYLLLSVIYKPKYLRWDIFLSLVIVVTSLSRGAILTYSFILLAHFFISGKQRLIITASSLSLLLVVLLFFTSSLLPDAALDYLQSFNPISENNALEQRAGFAHYAMDAFNESPIWGNGVGYLSSKLIERSIVVDRAIYSTATDAFWYILLAEMGLIGFLLYLLFLKEVFLSKNILTIALFIGFSIQLLGTDIPDMRFYYFAILVLVFMAKRGLGLLPRIQYVDTPTLPMGKSEEI